MKLFLFQDAGEEKLAFSRMGGETEVVFKG